jgi:3-phosphoshikimate 1-carboxyvinyltransferase
MIAAALLVPGSHLRIENVGLNPTRTAFLASLATMGAMVRWEATEDAYEPIGWVEAEYSSEMQGITLGADVGSSIPVAEMIDELPLLALVASQAHGITIVRDAAELRVKESDRISATARVLASLGIAMTELDDGFRINGGQTIEGGREVHHHGDHRLCMIAAVAALAARRPVTIVRPEVVDVSYPEFWRDLEMIAGCRLERTR